MWQSILCYLSGQHEFAVVCEPEAMYLKCRSCGRRSNGWALRSEPAGPHVHATARRLPDLVPAGALHRQHHSA